MSETAAVSLEALAERIEKLEKHIEIHCLRFDDVQDEHKSLAERMNEYLIRVEKLLSYANNALTADLYKLALATNTTLSAEFREKFEELLAEFKQEILAKKVVVTRPATREEIKTGTAVAVRQATPTELREQSQ
jgi:hypothetical protein